MNKRAIVIAGTVLICIMMFVSGYVLAQTNTAEQKDKELADLLGKVLLSKLNAKLFAIDPNNNADKIQATSDIAEAYGKGITKRRFVEAMVSDALRDYYSGSEDAKSAVQLSNVNEKAALELSLIQTMQNQRLIELMEQIAQNKK